MIVTTLRKIESWVVAVAIVANVSGAFVLLTLVAIMNADVVSRNLFNAPFRGVVEVVIFSLALIVFLQLPDVVRTGRLTRSDGFLSLLRHSSGRSGQNSRKALKAAISSRHRILALNRPAICGLISRRPLGAAITSARLVSLQPLGGLFALPLLLAALGPRSCSSSRLCWGTATPAT